MDSVINSLKPAVVLGALALSPSCAAIGEISGEKHSKGSRYVSPESADNTVYDSQYVENSRFAAYLVLAEMLRTLKPTLYVGAPIPIEYEEDGNVVGAWEVSLHDRESHVARLVYVVLAGSGRVILVCDRDENPECR